MKMIYLERKIRGRKEIISHEYNKFPKDSFIKKWCDDWNNFTHGEYIRLTKYMYHVNPYIGINV